MAPDGMPLGDADFALDPLPDLEQRLTALLEAGHQVVPVRYAGLTAHVILSYDAVAETFMDEATLPAAAAYERMAMPAQGRTLLAMKGEQHRKNRALVSGVLMPAVIRRRSQSVLVPLANALIDRLPAEGPVDLVAAYTKRYPFNVISALLGIPIADEKQLLEWVNLLFRYPQEPARALQAKADISAYLQPIIDARRGDPGDDIISQLAIAEVEGSKLTDEEILSFIRLIYPAGADTTFLAMGAMMREVLAQPDLNRRLLAHPEQRDDAIEEALRLLSPVALQVRYTEQPVTIRGTDIPGESWLLYGILPANRDTRHFERAEEFDATRRPNNHITFGRGPHFCIGRHLAREELKVSLSLLLDRLPGLRLAEPPPPSTGAVMRGVRKLLVSYDRVIPAVDPG